jgi:hypothetical protein
LQAGRLSDRFVPELLVHLDGCVVVDRHVEPHCGVAIGEYMFFDCVDQFYRKSLSAKSLTNIKCEQPACGAVWISIGVDANGTDKFVIDFHNEYQAQACYLLCESVLKLGLFKFGAEAFDECGEIGIVGSTNCRGFSHRCWLIARF